jgi:hypothetical protein
MEAILVIISQGWSVAWQSACRARWHMLSSAWEC